MTIPIILFAYSRPDCLRHTLECLKSNRVPLIYAYSDGPRRPDDAVGVAHVRQMLHEINWCEVVLCERGTNLGLGLSVRTGVSEVLNKHEAVIVYEDDLICVPGTYAYLCAALENYADDPRVMSVTGWTHPLITPSDVGEQPYFDGRAECLVWGTWARAWQGMEHDARTMMRLCKTRSIDIYRYGADLVGMAEVELQRNIWAVRFLYSHILNRGLCLRPPWSMVEHIGYGMEATNAVAAGKWASLPLKACPPMPRHWPEPLEHPECALLQQKACGMRPALPKRLYRQVRRSVSHVVRRVRGS